MGLKGYQKQNSLVAACILLVMALAFAFKAVLPAGFMPVVGKDGFTQIVICSGMSEKTILVPNDKAPSSDNKEDHTKICDYQVVSSNKILTTPALELLPVIATEQTAFEQLANAILPNALNLPFLARGPPSLLI